MAIRKARELNYNAAKRTHEDSKEENVEINKSVNAIEAYANEENSFFDIFQSYDFEEEVNTKERLPQSKEYVEKNIILKGEVTEHKPG